MVRPEPMTPRLLATAASVRLPASAISLVLSDVRRNEGSPTSQLKTINYLDNVIARARARTRGADDAVMLNNRGEIACVSAANIFWMTDGVVFTPQVQCGALAGVAGIHLMAAARRLGVQARAVAAPADALRRADAVFVTNSIIGVWPISRFEDRRFEESPLVRALADAL